jgi:hypothetical protein
MKSKVDEMDGACRRLEMHTTFWLESLKGKGHLENSGIGGEENFFFAFDKSTTELARQGNTTQLYWNQV